MCLVEKHTRRRERLLSVRKTLKEIAFEHAYVDVAFTNGVRKNRFVIGGHDVRKDVGKGRDLGWTTGSGLDDGPGCLYVMRSLL